MPATLIKTDDALELDLSSCSRGGDFTDTLAKIKEVPGAKFDWDRKVWLAPAEYAAAERILNAIQPKASPELIQWVKSERATYEKDLVTALPDDAEGLLIPWAYSREPYQPEEINGEPFQGLKPHQRAVVMAVASANDVKAIIADDMGLGKTATAISIVAESQLLAGRDPGPKLIVCPNSVKGVWEREVERWLGPDAVASVVDGSTPKIRGEQIELGINENGWVIVNYEQLRTFKEKKKNKGGGYKTIEKLKNPTFGTTNWSAVIADEVHRAKNRKAAQTRGLHRISGKVMLGLSGTPLMNSPDDLWSILHWLWPKDYTSYWRFFETYVDYVEGHFGKDIIGVKNPDALRFALNGKLYRRTKDQVLSLPEKQRITVPVKLDAKARKLYGEVETKLWIEIQEKVDQGDEEATKFVEAAEQKKLYQIPNGAARTVRLRQILSTPALLGGEDHSNKMDAVVDAITDATHKQHVVFSEFVGSCDILAERLSKSGLAVEKYTGETHDKVRAGIQDRFQAGQIDVLVGTLGAMREGLTLTAADTVHFLERSWVPAWNHQAEDRLHRIGQSNSVTIYIYEAVDTVDDGTIRLTNSLKDRIVRTVLPQDEIKES